jgi:hypothetical protein
MTDTANLALPYIEAAQAQKHVTHNEALRGLDALVQLAVLDRDLSSPPVGPAEGQRWIVGSSPSGAWAAHANEVAAWQDGGWRFYVPGSGWLAYVLDEAALLAWDGGAWVDAITTLTSLGALQNLTLLGVGTTADATNPFSAKLNNALWAAKTVAEGGDGDLRYKLSKESGAGTLSLLFQDNFSGRAEIGLAGDDDFHFKVSSDGSAWIDALVIDNASGSAKINSGLFFAGDLSPPQITANQNDYNPSGLAASLVLRLSTDASREITGLSGGSDGRVIVIINAGANSITLKDASVASAAGNRFAFGADLTLAAAQGALLWYDATSSRWRLVAATAGGSGGGGSAAGVSYSNGTSGLAATNVQSAIDELSAEKTEKTTTLTAGAGLAGGGDLSTNRSFDVGAGTGITVNANDVALDTAHSRNVDHGSVSITAGAGLTGGGTIAATRTIDVGAGAGITVNANDVAIATDGVTNAMLANMAQGTIKGRAPGAGTGDPTDLNAAQATAILDTMVGDSGAGGTKGLVPAPAAGDASAGRFLKADGTWAAPSGSGAPSDADYLVRTANGGLSAERVVTDTTDIAWDWGTGGQAKASVGAFTGDISKSANSLATTIVNDAVSNAKLANMAEATIKGRAAGAGSGDPSDLSPAQVKGILTLDTAVTVVIDGGGSAITTGVKGDVSVPFAGTILGVRLLGDQTGSIVVDIWKDTYANYPPTAADSIAASAKPTLSSATKSEDTGLTGWTTSISAADILRFNVDSASTVTRVTLVLTVRRT